MDSEKRSVWVKAGSAWMNRDGSVNVYLDVLPLDGKLHVREAVDERRAGADAASMDSKREVSHTAATSQWLESPAASLGGH